MKQSQERVLKQRCVQEGICGHKVGEAEVQNTSGPHPSAPSGLGSDTRLGCVTELNLCSVSQMMRLVIPGDRLRRKLSQHQMTLSVCVC